MPVYEVTLTYQAVVVINADSAAEAHRAAQEQVALSDVQETK